MCHTHCVALRIIFIGFYCIVLSCLLDMDCLEDYKLLSLVFCDVYVAMLLTEAIFGYFVYLKCMVGRFARVSV